MGKPEEKQKTRCDIGGGTVVNVDASTALQPTFIKRRRNKNNKRVELSNVSVWLVELTVGLCSGLFLSMLLIICFL